MPFEEALKFTQDVCEERAKQIKEIKRLEWSTDKVEKISELLKKFERDKENDEWEKLYQSKAADLNVIMGVRTKIAWLCGCYRDIRKQYAADKDDRLRTPADLRRFQVMGLLFNKKSLTRLNDIAVTERAKKIGK